MGEMIVFPADGRTTAGYLATPVGGNGPGVLVLHAWWGLTPLFRSLCDRLAGAGFVALAPDLHHGRTAATIEGAEALLSAVPFEEKRADVLGAIEHLAAHPAVRGSESGLGAVGFSMGAAWALYASTLAPERIAAAVAFYGTNDADYGAARAAYLGHYVEDDEWEPFDGVRRMEETIRAAGREITVHAYPGVRHWFFEEDRPEYDAEAARLAWERTLDFLRRQLGGD